jgi:hypothetical protein
MGRAWHGKKKYAYRILLRVPEGIRNIVAERITLKWLLEGSMWWYGMV